MEVDLTDLKDPRFAPDSPLNSRSRTQKRKALLQNIRHRRCLPRIRGLVRQRLVQRVGDDNLSTARQERSQRRRRDFQRKA